MQIFSKRFNSSIYTTFYMFNTFIEEAKDTIHFNEDEINDLLYFSLTLYDQKESIFKKRMTKVYFLTKMARLLNHINTDHIIALDLQKLIRLIDN